MNLVGEKIIHNSFGEGVITQQSDNIIVVKFVNKEAKFVFPDCFEKFMSCVKIDLQQEISEQIKAKQINEQQKQELEKQRLEEQRKILQQLSVNKKTTTKYSSGITGVYIVNFQAPSSYEELKYFYDENNRKTNLEILLDDVSYGSTIWSVPIYASVGDRILFYCSSTSIDTYHLTNAINESSDEEDITIARFGEKERQNYKKYAGKIICTGIVSEPPFRDTNSSHSARLLYAKINNLHEIKNPLTSKEINNFLRISRFNSITNVHDDQWKQLRQLIQDKNPGMVIE